jgi:Flp pilus assembly protein TadG
MPSPAVSSASFKGLLRRFRRNRQGAAALEFAILAPIFLALLFAILETALMFFAAQVLENVTQDSARMVLTGQAQTASYTQTQFANYVCTKVPALFTCANISIDVQSYSTFAAIPMSSQIDGGGNFINNMQYSPGSSGSIVVVRLFYQWPLFVTGLGYNIANLTGSKRLLVGTAVFQNEPYQGS